jgi:hypothetical protein
MPNDFLEQNLEQIIADNINTIQEKGFPFLFNCTKRQFRLPSGSIIDLISFQIDGKNITLRVFELKRKKISFDGLVQLYGYCLELYTLLYPYFENINIDKFLVGAEMDKSLQITLSHVSDVEVYVYEYQLNGINFKRFIPVWERTNDELLKDFRPTEKSAIFHQNIMDMFLDNFKLQDGI